VLPEYERRQIASYRTLYPEKITGYRHFYELADPSPATITRCLMNFSFALAGQVFTPVEQDEGEHWKFSETRRREASAADLLAITECAVQQLRLGYERYLDSCAATGSKAEVPDDWRALKEVWTAWRAILRDYEESRSSTEDSDTEAA